MKKPSNHNNSEKKRFKIPNKFVISAKGKKSNEISITPPKICPICGRKDVNGEFKLDSGRKFITVFLCNEHKELAEKRPYTIPMFLSLISFVLCIIFMPILFLLITIFITLIIFTIILTFFIFLLIFTSYKGFKAANYLNLIKEFINLKYFKKFSIVSIKRLDWTEEFNSLNQASEYKLDLKLIDELKKKRTRSAIYIGIMPTNCIPGIIFSFLLLGLGIIPYIVVYIIIYFLLFFMIGAGAFFLVIFTYYFIKIMDMED